MKTVLVVGGVGAQGAVVARHLAQSGDFKVVIFTRDITNQRAIALANDPNISLVANGAKTGYDLDAFHQAARKSDYAFLNTDGFALGEQSEIYWGIRLFETCAKAGIKHVVWSGLDSTYKDSGYDDAYYVGHYEGKSRVQDFIRSQPTTPMAWSIIRIGPYVETLRELWLPRVDDGGVYNFEYPLGDGAVPFICLEDMGSYVKWIFESPDLSTGVDLGLATCHATGQDIADAFTAVTGKQARYVDEPIDSWINRKFSALPKGPDTKIGVGGGVEYDSLHQSYRQNFTAWFNIYRASRGNVGLIQRDYAFLDHILPDRVKSVEEWMRVTGYDGKHESVLKGKKSV